MFKKDVCILFFVVLILLFAFRGISDFGEQVVKNYIAYVHHIPHEKLYVHTDKNTYDVGEDIWFRVYGVHALTHVPRTPSRFVYVELVDNRDSLVQRVKVGMRDSCFYGQLSLPNYLQTGDYCLRAYTYNLQRLGETYLFRKKIRVVCPKDERVQTDVKYRREKNSYVATIRFTSMSGEPYRYVPVRCSVGNVKNSYASSLLYTDKEGVLEIKADSANEVIRVRFENMPIKFNRYFRVPRLLVDFDVQFFPEGGTLLAGNRQRVAFEAVGSDGHPLEVTGTVYQDSVALFDIASEHDGMGSFYLDVNRLRKFQVRVTAEDGMEKWVELPASSLEDWGVFVERKGTGVEYFVTCGEDAGKPEGVYVMVVSGGKVFDIRAVARRTRGWIDTRLLPEGISQVVLLDEAGRVYSQRQFFVKREMENRLACRLDKREHSTRELVELEVELPEQNGGTFSLAVTDDGKVPVDENEENILSSLLLTSNVKGYIKNPGYYFSTESEEVERHLDLVMLTHGWTRFSPRKIAKGEFPNLKYEIEMGQVISGRVKNFWGKESAGTEISLFSNKGHCVRVETDMAGRFRIDNILFSDTTRFVMQVLRAKGRHGVEAELDRDSLIVPSYDLLCPREEKKPETDSSREEFAQGYYYVDGQKIHVLDEVEVKRRRAKHYYSIYSSHATVYRDSSRLADMAKQCDNFFQLLGDIPGVTVEKGGPGDCVMRFGKRMTVFVNDIEMNTSMMNMLYFMPLDMLKNISVLDIYSAELFFRDRKISEGGLLLIYADPKYYSTIMNMRRERVNMSSFTLLGYQEPAEFYVPRYDVDSVRQDTTLDRRPTIYWNPAVKVAPGRRTKVSFYTTDETGTYTVILEGVTRDGVVSRWREKLEIK